MTDSTPTEPPYRPIELKRVQHPVRLAVFAVAVIVLLAASFVAGAVLIGPATVLEQNADQRVAPVVLVERRVVAPELRLTATIVDGASYIIAPNQETEGAIAAVVSASGVPPGSILGFGAIAAEISGRPLITVPASMPIYRDLSLGMSGNDVTALQSMLVQIGYDYVTVSGTLDWRTLQAMRELYGNGGYDLPSVDGEDGIAARELTRIPGDQGVVTQMAEVGTPLDEEHPLATVQISPRVLVAIASLPQADRLTVGQTVIVSAGGLDPVESTVTVIGEFSRDEATGASGKPITVALPDSLSAVEDGLPITVGAGPVTTESLALPLIAVQQDATGAFVESYPTSEERKAEESASSEQRDALRAERRVDITVVAQAEGWVAIEETKALPVGTRLELPG